jgi:hypothetical protein
VEKEQPRHSSNCTVCSRRHQQQLELPARHILLSSLPCPPPSPHSHPSTAKSQLRWCTLL